MYIYIIYNYIYIHIHSSHMHLYAGIHGYPCQAMSGVSSWTYGHPILHRRFGGEELSWGTNWELGGDEIY